MFRDDCELFVCCIFSLAHPIDLPFTKHFARQPNEIIRNGLTGDRCERFEFVDSTCDMKRNSNNNHLLPPIVAVDLEPRSRSKRINGENSEKAIVQPYDWLIYLSFDRSCVPICYALFASSRWLALSSTNPIVIVRHKIEYTQADNRRSVGFYSHSTTSSID